MAKGRLKNPDNWIRHRFSDGKGRYCILGACGYLEDGLSSGIQERLLEAIKTFKPDWPAGVAQWNDGEAYTHADVLAVLDKAIELESGK